MSTLKFYSKLPDMECLSGDTLPTFEVEVEADSLSGCTMQLIVADSSNTAAAVICKECTAIEGGFRVTLDSSDTTELSEGCYSLHFRLIDPNGRSHRKLCGELYVHSVPKGGT